MLTDYQVEPQTVAIAYEAPTYRDALKGAVAAAGAVVSRELKLSELNEEALSGLEESALVVNLEQVVVHNSGILEMLLECSFNGTLLFNDADATARLRGADKARWVRHLASKISSEVSALPPRPQMNEESSANQQAGAGQQLETWVLCASIGGPEALRAFLAALDEGIPFSFVLAQHIGAEFIGQMSLQLNNASTIPVRLAEQGDSLQPGQVLVVPSDKAIGLTDQQMVTLSDLGDGASYTPCIDQVIASLIEQSESAVNAIIFSGMAEDGVEGARQLSEHGGLVWVQDPETCVVSSMVDGASERANVSFSGDPVALAKQINHRAAQMLQKTGA